MKKTLLLLVITFFVLWSFAFTQESRKVVFSKFRYMTKQGDTSTHYTNLCDAYFTTQNGVNYMFLDNANHTALSNLEEYAPKSSPNSTVLKCVSMIDDYKTIIIFENRQDGKYMVFSVNEYEVFEYKIDKMEQIPPDDEVLNKLIKRHIK